MGDTLEKLATSISATDSSYALWMTSQVFVGVSRVKELKNPPFIGSTTTRLSDIESIFEKRELREERLFNLLDKMKNNSRCNSSIQPMKISKLSYVPFNKNIPSTPNGFEYLLISLKPTLLKTFYVGETEQALLTRLSEHNCCNYSDFTRTPHRLPWAVAAFICNFHHIFRAGTLNNKDIEKGVFVITI